MAKQIEAEGSYYFDIDNLIDNVSKAQTLGEIKKAFEPTFDDDIYCGMLGHANECWAKHCKSL